MDEPFSPHCDEKSAVRVSRTITFSIIIAPPRRAVKGMRKAGFIG